MDAPYDGAEVTVLMEEIEEAYYTSPGPPKKKKKYKIHGEKAKKPRLAIVFWLLMVLINKFAWGAVLKKTQDSFRVHLSESALMWGRETV
jgi:hypothetical protein